MRKGKIAAYTVSYLVLVYAIIIIAIHSPKSVPKLVEETYGNQMATLDNVEARLRIVLALYTPRPSSIRIEQIKPPMKNKQKEINLLDSASAAILLAAIGNK